MRLHKFQVYSGEERISQYSVKTHRPHFLRMTQLNCLSLVLKKFIIFNGVTTYLPRSSKASNYFQRNIRCRKATRKLPRPVQRNLPKSYSRFLFPNLPRIRRGSGSRGLKLLKSSPLRRWFPDRL